MVEKALVTLWMAKGSGIKQTNTRGKHVEALTM